MERRAFGRIPSNIKIRFQCDGMDYSGTVANLSENGMFINTEETCFPYNLPFEVLIPLKNKILHVPINLIRMISSPNSHNGIGVRLLNPPQNYLELVNDLRSDL
jgi:hypothetical protein